MRVTIRDIDEGFAGTPMAGQRLFALIEPAINRGEVVVLDFEGVRHYAPAFFHFSIGTLMDKDSDRRVERLISYENLSAEGRSDLEWMIEKALWRRENPAQAAALDAVIRRKAKEAWE